MFNKILIWLRLRKPVARPIAELLPAEVLQAALAEARFLRQQHRVSVKNLAPGELPMSKRAEESDY